MKKKITTIGLLIIVFAGFFFFFKSLGKDIYYSSDTMVYEDEPAPNIPILFTGDVMLGRYVETLMNNGLDPFGTTTEVLKRHITILNLEGPIPEKHTPTPIPGMSFSFPSTTPKFLKDHEVAAVSLANNHGFDKGREGYENTKKVLLNAGVDYFGAYDTTMPDYYQAFIGDEQVVVFGINMVSMTWDERKALEVASNLQASFPDALLVSYIHWGNEYDLMQGDAQRELAHKLIDRGVDAIIGAHPHVVQGVEVYKNSPIFYSLGNFIFDQYFEKNVERGLLVSIDKNNQGFVYKLIPVGSKRSQAFIADGELYSEILDTISNSSDENIREQVRSGKIIIHKLLVEK